MKRTVSTLYKCTMCEALYPVGELADIPEQIGPVRSIEDLKVFDDFKDVFTEALKDEIVVHHCSTRRVGVGRLAGFVIHDR